MASILWKNWWGALSCADITSRNLGDSFASMISRGMLQISIKCSLKSARFPSSSSTMIPSVVDSSVARIIDSD